MQGGRNNEHICIEQNKKLSDVLENCKNIFVFAGEMGRSVWN